MKTAWQVVDEFWEMAEGRCSLDLKSGVHLEGYILEVGEENIVFGHGGPMVPDEDDVIAIGDIDLDTLYFYSDKERCYLHAQWEEDADEWKLTPFRPTLQATAPPETPPHSRTSFLVGWLKRKG